MCYSLHVAVNVCINCSFLHLLIPKGQRSTSRLYVLKESFVEVDTIYYMHITGMKMAVDNKKIAASAAETMCGFPGYFKFQDCIHSLRCLGLCYLTV